jgi:hypothetical protein
LSSPEGEEASEQEGRRARTIAAALNEILTSDIEEQARKGGFTCENLADGSRRISIPSFGEHVRIIMPSGDIFIPSQLDSLTMRVLALRYVKLSSGVPVSGEWIGYRDLPGGRFYSATISPTIEKPLARVFGGKRGYLEEAARELAGRQADYGDESFIFHPFPRTPILLVLHWGDEEFEADSRVLFDRCCSGYLNTDDLKILATQLAAYLLRWAGADQEVENLLWMVE